jgi:Protein of unknown function (DUF3592)
MYNPILFIVPALFGGVGLLLLLIGLLVFLRKRAFLSKAATVPGTVVALLTQAQRDLSLDPELRNVGLNPTQYDVEVSFFPLVRFQTKQGQTVEFRSSVGSTSPAYFVGQQVTILYDPANPIKASISSFGSLWLSSLLLFGVGSLFTAIGVIFLALVRG